MSLFTTVKCIGGWIERPFNGAGDSAHKIYRLQCLVDAGSYASLALTAVLTNATTAGVDVLPASVGPDANAYFVGDSTPQPYGNGPLVSFVRSFATVPAVRTRGLGSYSYAFPAFRKWHTTNQNASNETVAADPVVALPEIVLREGFTESSPAKVTYTYTYATAIENVTADTLFQPIWNSTTSNQNIYLGDLHLQPVPFLVDWYSSHGTSSPPSDPNLTDYMDNYIDTLYIKVASSIKSYLGNIFVRETISVLAK